MKRRRVVITGLGTISPIGNDTKTFWDSLCAGKSGIGKITHFDTTGFTSRIAGEIRGYDPSKYLTPKDRRRTDIFVQYAVSAAGMAIDDAGIDLSSIDLCRFGAIVGSGIGGIQTIESEHKVLLERGPSRISPFFIPMLIVNMAPGYIAIKFGLQGPNSCSVTACASSNHSLGEAFRIIQHGYADLMIGGGSEAAIWALGVAGFCAAKALSTRNDEPEKASRPFDRDRDGFVMSEGSGVLLLEEYEHAKKRGADIYAELVGYGMSCDAYHMTAPDPEGRGAIRCMEGALKDAGMNADELTYINAHGTSTKLNDKVETAAIKKVFGSHAKKLAVSSTKSMTGHLLGAAGGAELAACALAIKNGIIPPTINYENQDPDCDLDYVPNEARKQDVNVALSNSLGFGGHNASLIIRKI
ncbi:MAG: beta-ketoacyl-ACP synthase II [Candidatus Omnitrophica bacterium]|nr:beta-ketoacyl-ACP synthase II [Candidatus Omnitrophota bacterium]